MTGGKTCRNVRSPQRAPAAIGFSWRVRADRARGHDLSAAAGPGSFLPCQTDVPFGMSGRPTLASARPSLAPSRGVCPEQWPRRTVGKADRTVLCVGPCRVDVSRWKIVRSRGQTQGGHGVPLPKIPLHHEKRRQQNQWHQPWPEMIAQRCIRITGIAAPLPDPESVPTVLAAEYPDSLSTSPQAVHHATSFIAVSSVPKCFPRHDYSE